MEMTDIILYLHYTSGVPIMLRMIYNAGDTYLYVYYITLLYFYEYDYNSEEYLPTSNWGNGTVLL